MALLDKIKEKIQNNKLFKKKEKEEKKKDQLNNSDFDSDLANIEAKYIEGARTKKYKKYVIYGLLILGIIVISCLFDIGYKIYTVDTTELHIPSYASWAALLVAFILVYLVPIIKVFRSPHFITKPDGSKENKRRAVKYNEKLRYDLASAIVKLNETELIYNARWYYEDEKHQDKNDEIIEKLAIAVKINDKQDIKNNLELLYKGPIKKTAKKIINKTAVRVGFYSAVSRSNTADAVIVASLDIKMIKDIVFLYGFRPDDAKLAKIYAAVIKNTFIALGVASIPAGNIVGNAVAKFTESVPWLGSIISTVVDPVVQGTTNTILTSLLGFQTVRYLLKDYKIAASLGDEMEDGRSVYDLEKDIWKQNVDDVAKEAKKDNTKKTKDEVVSSLFA